MKKLYIIAILLTFTYTSCKEDVFLTEKPQDALYADNLFESYDGFRLAVNALLDWPRQERSEMIQSAELGIIWKIGVDNGWSNAELSWTRGLNKYNVDLNPEMQFINGDTGGRDGIFLILYKAIAAANTVITRGQNPDVDWQGGSVQQNEVNKNLMVAHAHLIRAWAYRHLVYTFGAVPITTEEITGVNYRNDWERSPVPDVQAFIVEDLKFAEEYLPDYSDNVLVLSKVIAQHYLAEMYLWMNDPAKAEEEALKVVNNPRYKLITQRYGVNASKPGVAFMDQFLNGNILPSEGDTEALWIFPNTDVLEAIGARGNAMRRTWVVNYNSYAPYTPENGGRGLARGGMTAWAFSIYEPQDDRFSKYAIAKSYTNSDGITITNTQTSASQMNVNNNKWASTRKWDWTYADPSLWNASYSYADQTYIRLADTYLLLAEAYFKQGKLAESAGMINQIRTRSHATPIVADGSTITMDYILDERSRELVTEENRRETLIRTGKLLERARNPLYNKFTTAIQDFQVLLPVPQKVIDANTGKKMEQNPGY
ncbi:putative outer membrane protein [Arcticibacter svalbardensis MN12-7]|uniref:Putative outer membrane protein n=1 Tax=Arcticibacter svalbardensis MN12-7 TaxID=1150600 RepID=R9GU94_9SPHI|nr:RagB/SusD family nutrient uptake outer membrane protein [Arcticibacter svalbardensis]EOR95238.1 putative outer membrane protein [Arcticibacter svalbardensis MN12-7]